MALRCLVLLLSVAAGGIHGQERQGPQGNSKSMSEFLKTDLDGQQGLSTGLRGVAMLVSYNMCMWPGVHSLWDGRLAVKTKPWMECFEPNAAVCESMHAATDSRCDVNLETRCGVWSPEECNTDAVSFPCDTAAVGNHGRWTNFGIHFQCDSGNHDRAVFHGWQVHEDIIFHECGNHFHGNSGNFHSVNNFQSSAGKFHFQCSSGLINNYDLFQSGSGKIDSLSLWGASIFSALQSICSACDMSFFGMTGSDLQCQTSELSTGPCSAEDFNGLQVMQSFKSCSQGILTMDVGGDAELGEFDFNWTRFATIENKFNVVTTSMIGLQFFQNMIKLMAVTWSMVHAAVCFLAGCTVMQLAVLASTVTAMVCLVWYLRAGMSHLSYGRRF